MTADVLDYVRDLNKLSEDLLSSHSESLGRKNIRRKQQLIRAIRLDLDKLTHALMEVKEGSAPLLLRRFLEPTSLNHADVCERLADARIYHVGFEIHEPLDLVLYGIDHWIRQSNRTLGANLRVRNYLRFPASPAFQKRVGAYAEIMRIWLDVGDRVLMLELFDIHRPADSFLESPRKLTHRNFQCLFGDHDADSHDDRLAKLFVGDEIWHYALFVREPGDVSELHAELQTVATGNDTYFMPYAAPVYNKHDNSFHTKVVQRDGNAGMRLELEFVTDYGPAVPG